MSEFTKGPWSPFIEGKTIAIFDSKKKQVISWVGFDSSNFPISIQKKNARLIASAPDMYEALRKFKEDWCNLNGHMKASTLDSIDAALSKATGESTDAPGA